MQPCRQLNLYGINCYCRGVFAETRDIVFLYDNSALCIFLFATHDQIVQSEPDDFFPEFLPPGTILHDAICDQAAHR